MRLFVTLLALLILTIGGVSRITAHASLASADPAPNSRLTDSPASIHLTFTEPIEPAFIRLDMRASDGASASASPPTASADGTTISLALLPDLSDGVYSVDWRVVSATDGHPTRGSYPLIIGANAPPAIIYDTELNAPIPVLPAWARAFNLFGLALFAGVPLFARVIWRRYVRASRRTMQELAFESASGDHRLWALMWFGWAMTGIAAVVMLIVQTETLIGDVTIAGMAETAFATRYGSLWLVRAGLWGAFGAALLYAMNSDIAGQHRWRIGGLLVLLSCGVLLMQSLYSHTAGVALILVVFDFTHLIAAAAWIGGLAALIALVPIFRLAPVQTPALGGLVGRFSVLARGALLLLILSAVILARVHVESWEGLLTTDYGIALLLKLALFAPALAIGGFNSFITERRLRAGGAVWSGRLRGLVTVEIALLTGAIAAVGVMTSIAPARVTLDARAEQAVAASAESSGYFEMVESGELMAHLIIDPGVIGENTFTVELFEAVDLIPVTDATLIRMRFRPVDGSGSESELRPVHVGEGRYSVSGANLSAPGEWRVRVSVQRPSEFDAVFDFHPVLPLIADGGADANVQDRADAIFGIPTNVPDAAYATGGVTANARPPLLRIVSTHGYWFVLGLPVIVRIGQGGWEDDVRLILTPDGSRSRDLVMMADHSHALLSGDAVYRTSSLGLGWRALDAPAPIFSIAPDDDDRLLAYAADAVYMFNPFSERWSIRSASE